MVKGLDIFQKYLSLKISIIETVLLSATQSVMNIRSAKLFSCVMKIHFRSLLKK